MALLGFLLDAVTDYRDPDLTSDAQRWDQIKGKHNEGGGSC